jgi:Ca2+-binding RTX toxin-like protein
MTIAAPRRLVRLGILGCALTLCAAVLCPAGGAATCALDGSVLRVSSSTGETITLATAAGAITVNAAPCAGATTTTVTSITIVEEPGANVDQTLVIDLAGGPFGAVGIDVDLGGGSDAVDVKGGTAAESFRWGTAGLDLTDDGNPDVTIANADALAARVLEGLGGDDRLSGQGGGATGSPLLVPVTLRGGNDNDALTGGESDDEFRGGDGDDSIDGRGGSDTMVYGGAEGPVVVDLGAGTASGEGADRLSAVENVTGSDLGDTITGDSNANVIRARLGDDIVDGGSGADTLVGDEGNDTLGGGTDDDALQGRGRERRPGDRHGRRRRQRHARELRDSRRLRLRRHAPRQRECQRAQR